MASKKLKTIRRIPVEQRKTPDIDLWVYGYTLDGMRIGRGKMYENMQDSRGFEPRDARLTAWLLFKRKNEWLLFELEHPSHMPIPEKVLMRQWANGYEPLSFPTRNAAHVFMKLRSS